MSKDPSEFEHLDHDRLIDQIIELRLEVERMHALTKAYTKEVVRWLTKQELAEEYLK